MAMHDETFPVALKRDPDKYPLLAFMCNYLPGAVEDEIFELLDPVKCFTEDWTPSPQDDFENVYAKILELNQRINALQMRALKFDKILPKTITAWKTHFADSYTLEMILRNTIRELEAELEHQVRESDEQAVATQLREFACRRRLGKIDGIIQNAIRNTKYPPSIHWKHLENFAREKTRYLNNLGQDIAERCEKARERNRPTIVSVKEQQMRRSAIWE